MRLDRRTTLRLAAAMGAGMLMPDAAQSQEQGEEGELFKGERTDGGITVLNTSGKPLLRYVHEKLAVGEKAPSVEGVCFTHPVYTPDGEVVTDLAPADHPHHRGVFCAWVKLEGEKLGDWWGWGAKAPKEQRLLVNREARVTDATEDSVVVRLINSWRAEEETVLRERLTLTARAAAGCNVLDFDYKFTPGGRSNVVIAQNPFGGFCYRAKPRGELIVTNPEGLVKLPDAIFDKKEANWPAAHWYDLSYKNPDEVTSGVAVMDHPNNPLSTWHVVRGIHMLNPCIVAEGPQTIPFGEPLYLRYRVVAHDGPADAETLQNLYDAFVNTEG